MPIKQFAVYAIVSLVIGPCFSFWWAFFFAIFQLVVVWIIQPFIKYVYIALRVFNMVIDVPIRRLLDPVMLSMSLLLSGIKGRFQLDNANVNVKTRVMQDV